MVMMTKLSDDHIDDFGYDGIMMIASMCHHWALFGPVGLACGLATCLIRVHVNADHDCNDDDGGEVDDGWQISLEFHKDNHSFNF